MSGEAPSWCVWSHGNPLQPAGGSQNNMNLTYRCFYLICGYRPRTLEWLWKTHPSNKPAAVSGVMAYDINSDPIAQKTGKFSAVKWTPGLCGTLCWWTKHSINLQMVFLVGVLQAGKANPYLSLCLVVVGQISGPSGMRGPCSRWLTSAVQIILSTWLLTSSLVGAAMWYRDLHPLCPLPHASTLDFTVLNILSFWFPKSHLISLALLAKNQAVCHCLSVIYILILGHFFTRSG